MAILDEGLKSWIGDSKVRLSDSRAPRVRLAGGIGLGKRGGEALVEVLGSARRGLNAESGQAAFRDGILIPGPTRAC